MLIFSYKKDNLSNPDIRFRSKDSRPDRKDFSNIKDYLDALEEYYDQNPNERPQIKKVIAKAQNSVLNDPDSQQAHDDSMEYYQRVEKQKVPLNETLKRMREFWIDQMYPIRLWQEEIVKRGGKLPNTIYKGETTKVDPYRDVRNMFGRMEALYRTFQEDNIEPIQDAIANIVKSGMPVEGITLDS